MLPTIKMDANPNYTLAGRMGGIAQMSVALVFMALALLGCKEDVPTVDPNCEPGTIGCECAEDECAEGRCADDVCVACPEGTLRCPCGPEETCGDGLTCSEGLCEEDEVCPAGSLDCPCGPEDACDEGLTCMDNSCVALPECPPGTEDCPCDEQEGCEEALVCINALCRDCPADQNGCPCDEGLCGGGLVCEEGACREAVACVDAGCGPFQLCQAAEPGADAQCLEDCEEGHTWNDALEACEEVPPLANCTEGEPGSIAQQCAEANRQCVEADGDEPADAVCGDCLAGFLLEGEACVPDLRANYADDAEDANSILADCQAQNRLCVPQEEGAVCGECGDGFLEDPNTSECRGVNDFGACESIADCPEGLVCGALRPEVQSRCLPAACAEGEFFDIGDQACSDRCNCDGAGLTGRVWPFSDWNGDCVCETLEGYFFNTASGSRQAEPCDGDGDGWTRRSAFAHINEGDESVRLNARCDLRTIDKVTLVNEWGQRLDLDVATLSNGLSQVEPLYETDENDDESETLERQSVPYGQRKFHAAELNPLTKACVSARDDFNDNGISDLREHHRNTPEPQNSWMQTFMAATYFVELHRGRYQAPVGDEPHGRYVIEERSRCDAGFALGYDSDEGDYASSCSRRRDQSYDAAEPVGHDFQRWSCDEPQGACPVVLPPVADVSVNEIPPHGLCEERVGEDPVPWRGMGHSSQFKCVEVVNDDAPEVAPFEVRQAQVRTAISAEAPFNLNACGLRRCEEDDVECLEFEARNDEEALANPSQPIVTCDAEVETVTEPLEELLRTVGWVSKRFEDYADPFEYAGGCINEQSEWPQLCPGFDPLVPFATVGQGNPNNFGKLNCGCGLNYGGVACDEGCPSDQLHFGGSNPNNGGFCDNGYCVTTPDEDGEDGGRSGFWMCANFSATSYTEALPEVGEAFQGTGTLQIGQETLSGSVTIRGQMPTFGTDGKPMCQNVDEEGRCSGFIVR